MRWRQRAQQEAERRSREAQQVADKAEREAQRLSVDQARAAEDERERARTALIASQSRFTRLMFQANVVLVFVTAIMAGIAVWQAYLTGKSVEVAQEALSMTKTSSADTAKFAEETLKIATTSANAASKSADISEQTLKLTQRAFLTFENWSLISPIEIGQSPSFETSLRNVGVTAATLTRGNVTTFIGQTLPEKPRYPTIRDEGAVVLAPQQVMRRPWYREAPFTATEVAAVNTGAARIFVYGFVEYVDAFGQRQEAPFCVRYDIQSKRMNQCALSNYHAGPQPSD